MDVEKRHEEVAMAGVPGRGRGRGSVAQNKKVT